LNKKISDKDIKDWKDFTSGRENLPDKDISILKKSKKKVKTIDLHGLSIDDSNKVIKNFILTSFKEGINKIIVITGKGLRSKNEENPYVSKDLSILKNSVPEYIKLNKDLMKIIKQIEKATIEDGGDGAFYIYLKNFKG
tara:strand:- start:56 stop:472 length:417 start_codon:yes stop_codon:yes gene_type:complete